MQSYYRPTSIDEALALLAEHKGHARAAAGATDLFIDIEKKRLSPDHVVDIRRIPELRKIETRGEKLFIGAAATHAEIADNGAVIEKFTALAEGCASVGGPQIRNVGTIGGNVANAQPAADGAIPLAALDAIAIVVSHSGEREVPLLDLYEGPGRSRLDSTSEILKGFLLPVGRYRASAFVRSAKRRALSLPTLNVAAAIGVLDGRIVGASVAAGPVAQTLMRFADVEAMLIGEPPSDELFSKVARRAASCASPRDSMLRGSAEHRKKLLEEMLPRALAMCVERIR